MKHVWGETDPFSFPPREYKFGVLQAVEPFLRIHRHPRAVLQLGGNDKFKGGKMKSEVLEAVLQMIGCCIADYERSYANSATELNLRPRHLELIRQVEKFTKPTETEYIPPRAGIEAAMAAMAASGDIEDEDEVDQKGFKMVLAEMDEQLEEEGTTIVMHSPDDSPKTSSSSEDEQEGLHLDTEAPPQGPYEVPDKGRTDARVFFFNEGPRRRAQSEVQRLRLSAQRCGIVGEFKADELWEAIAQAAACARPEVRRNLLNRHFKPIYLLAMSKHRFTYAILKAEGQIITGGNKVSDKQYAEFLEATQPGSSPSKREVIDEMFSIGSRFLCDNYRNKPGAKYPKRPYIVGDLYVAPEWYMLPTTTVDNGFVSAGARKFYEGLLRISLGDQVLKFNVSDVVTAVGVRMAQSFKQASGGGLNSRAGFFNLCGAQMLAIGLHCVSEEHDDEQNKRQRLL